MIERISAILILLLSILFLPFWVSVILALAGMAYFSFFWESVALFFLSDLLFGVEEAKFSNMLFVSFFIFLLILIVIELIKKRLRT